MGLKMRDEFEAWARSVMLPNLERYGDGQYRAPHIEIAWSAWQAAKGCHDHKWQCVNDGKHGRDEEWKCVICGEREYRA